MPVSQTAIDLQRMVRTSPDLEPLPMSVTHLAALVAKEETEMQEIAKVISYDQVLTTSLLRSANAANMAGKTPVTTVKDAVIRVGTGTVLSVALSASVSRRLGRALPQYGLNEGDLWAHSVAAALAVEELPKFTRVRVPPEAVTAALLHDIGKLVIAQIMTPSSITMMATVKDQLGATRLEAEAQILETDHARIGGELALAWKLPQTIARGIAFHHKPPPSNNTIPCAVHIADMVSKAVGAGLEDDNRNPETLQYCLEQLSLSGEDYFRLCGSVAEKFHEVKARYG